MGFLLEKNLFFRAGFFASQKSDTLIIPTTLLAESVMEQRERETLVNGHTGVPRARINWELSFVHQRGAAYLVTPN